MSYVPRSNGARSRNVGGALDSYDVAVAVAEKVLAPGARDRLTELDGAVSGAPGCSVDLIVERERAW